MERKLRRVTQKQLEEGWSSFHPDKIPNVQRHQYEVHSGPHPGGTWIVYEPTPVR